MKKTYSFLVLLFSIILICFGTLQAQWSWQHPLPQGNHLMEVAFIDSNNGTAVGARGTIIMTKDGGTSWSIQESGTLNNLLGVYFTSSDKGTVVGAGGTILRTIDGGITWVSKTSGTTAGLNSVYYTDEFTGTAVGTGGTILQTRDGGNLWTPQISGTTGGLYDVAFFNANVGFAVGYGSLLRTTDGGITWASAYAVGEESSVQCVSVSQDGNTALAVGFDVEENAFIWRTTNQGVSWTPQSITGYFIASDISFGSANSVTVVGYPYSNVKRSTDGGATWINQPTGLPGMGDILYGVSFSDKDHGTVVGNFGLIHRTTDGGDTWFRQSGADITSQMRDVHFLDRNTGIVVGIMMAEVAVENGIFRTTNKGETWVRQYTIPNGNQSPYEVDFCDANNGFIIGGYGVILKTSDGGITWTHMPDFGTLSMLSVDCIDPNTATITGFMGRISRTTDGGATWVQQVSGTTTSALWDVEFFNADTGVAIGTLGTILRTTNGGNTWTSIVTGTTTNLYAAYFLDANTGWTVGNSGLILKTTDGGLTWNTQVSGVTTQLLDVNFANANVGTIVGVTGTVLNTTNGGETWTQEQTPNTVGFWGVFYTDAYNTWAVGDWGRIYHRCTGIAPSVPANLTAVADTHFVNLNWTDSSDNEEGFKIERKDDSLHIIAPWVEIAVVGSDITAYADTAVSPNTTYSYRVYAYNEYGNSLYSDSIEATTIIPVELLSFSVSADENSAVLYWQTATETNNKGFEIQRKKNQETNWTSIGYVAGYGTTTEPKAYSFTDNKAAAGKYTYCLKQIDLNGTYSYSKEVEVEIGFPEQFVLEQNYPNPFNPNTTIKYALPYTSNVKIIIFNMLGETIGVIFNGVQESGYYQVNWNAGNLASGIYFYSLEAKSTDGLNVNKSIKKMLLMK